MDCMCGFFFSGIVIDFFFFFFQAEDCIRDKLVTGVQTCALPISKMASESSVFRERFDLVDSPSEYYTIVSFLDLFEYVFHLNKMQMLDETVWKRWEALTETIMTIPKFRSIWIKTKESHPDKDFGEFIDSLLVQK